MSGPTRELSLYVICHGLDSLLISLFVHSFAFPIDTHWAESSPSTVQQLRSSRGSDSWPSNVSSTLNEIQYKWYVNGRRYFNTVSLSMLSLLSLGNFTLREASVLCTVSFFFLNSWHFRETSHERQTLTLSVSSLWTISRFRSRVNKKIIGIKSRSLVRQLRSTNTSRRWKAAEGWKIPWNRRILEQRRATIFLLFSLFLLFLSYNGQQRARVLRLFKVSNLERCDNTVLAQTFPFLPNSFNATCQYIVMDSSCLLPSDRRTKKRGKNRRSHALDIVLDIFWTTILFFFLFFSLRSCHDRALQLPWLAVFPTDERGTNFTMR